MGSILKHAALGCVVGVLLAGGVWLAWWLGSLALGADAWDQFHALWPTLAVGIVAGLAGASLAGLLLRTEPREVETSHAPALDEKPEGAAQKNGRLVKRRRRRRHSLDKIYPTARFTPLLRWQTQSKGVEALLRGRLVGKPIYHRLHPEDVPAVDKAFQDAAVGDATSHVVCRFLTADQSGTHPPDKSGSSRSDTKLLPALTPDSFVTLRIDIWASKDGAGKVRRYVCRFVDLTAVVLQKDIESQVAARMLSRVKKRLRAVNNDMDRLKLSYRELYQNAPVMYFSLDSQGRLVTFNDTLLNTLGYSREDLRNRNYTLLLPPALAKDYVSIAQSMPSQAGESETQWRKKDGTQFDVWLHTIPVYDQAGKFVRYRNAALDLSEKNRLANELRSRGDELERTNQRLREINSELEAFTHVVSHDLKEPLRTLQAYSHLLAEEHSAELGPDGFQYINHLIRASRRLGALIDELLNLSRAGRNTREPTVFNLIEVVATVRQDLVDLIQRKEAIILTEGSLPDVVGDPVRITQLLTNLVANGLKYNRDPAPVVVVGAAAGKDDPTHATIFVRDNGIGIDAAFHQQIFGIFRRLHQAEEFEGTGAGLAICKKIVEGHGGRIWVESRVGAGATFYFTLPRAPTAKPAGPANGKSAAPARADNGQPSSRRRRTNLQPESGVSMATQVVLVEDQSDVGMIIQKLGKRDGLAVTWFPTAEEAWEHLQNHGADLLLFDVNLPGFSGVELCRRVRTLSHHAETPVAMFTPDHEAEKLDALREAGADFFLTKDLLCEPAAWQQRIKELLDQIRTPAPH